MAVPTTTPLPIPPNRTSGAGVFPALADRFYAAMPQFQTDMNTLATYSGQQASLADTARIAAEQAKAAAESARSTAVTRANEVATNTNTVVARADEVAANTQQVAANTQQVAADAQAVADALASVADGPVTSVAGQTGVVTLEQLRAGGVSTQAGAETLTNKIVSGPRASMAQYIDKTVTNGSATGAVTLDLSAADVFDLTLSGNTTLSISNPPVLSGETFSIIVRVRQGATAYSLAWFSGVTWLAISTPATPAANKIAEYVFTTTDGAEWLGGKGRSN